MIKPGRQEVAMGTSSWASAYTSGTVKQQETVQQQPTATVPEETKETSMSKKKASKATKPKSKKQTKRKAAAASNGAAKYHRTSKKGITVERFPKICGYSATAVARHLGVVEGVKFPHASAIMKANGVKIPDYTLKVHLCLRTRPPAPLTKEQVKELLASAPEPETEAVAA